MTKRNVLLSIAVLVMAGCTTYTPTTATVTLEDTKEQFIHLLPTEEDTLQEVAVKYKFVN